MDVDVRSKIWLVALLMLGGGCHNLPNPSIELLESELRWMEDQLYTLDYQLDQQSRQLDSCRRNNTALKNQLHDLQNGQGELSFGQARSEEPTPTISTPTENRSTNPSSPPTVAAPDVDEFEDDLQIPDVDLGPDADLEWSPEPRSLQTDPREDAETPNSARLPQVRRITLNKRLTGVYHFDNPPGDEGLMVVIEPQDASGNYVPLPGDLSIRIIDANSPNAATPIAQWVYFAEETVPFIKETLMGKGIHLQLPWPNGPPNALQLRILVTYKAPSTDTLTAHRKVRGDSIAQNPNQRPTRPLSLGGRVPSLHGPSGLSQFFPRVLRTPYRQNPTRRTTYQSARPRRNMPPTWQ